IGLNGVGAGRKRNQFRSAGDVHIFKSGGDVAVSVRCERPYACEKTGLNVCAAHEKGVLAFQAGIGKIAGRRWRGRRGAIAAASSRKQRETKREEQSDPFHRLCGANGGGEIHRAPPCWLAAAFLAAPFPRATPGVRGNP